MQDANQKVNRALQAGAMAIGAAVDILDLPGYLPSICDARLDGLFASNMTSLLGPEAVGPAGHQTGSTDIGDISHLMPALHAYIKAGKGNLHTEEFVISDPHLAYIESAKGLALTAVDLLWDGAREGLSIKKNYRAKYTKDEYLKTLTQLSQSA
jgi:metal-dependent amidase/aminoacylase/carboxypeptidase family protein